jgi:hypothetical protein
MSVLHELLRAVNINTRTQEFLTQEIRKMTAAVDALTAAVAAQTTVEASVVTLLQTLTSDLQAGIDANDLAAIQAATTAIQDGTAQLAAAVTANTPVPASSPTPPAASTTPSTPATGS